MRAFAFFLACLVGVAAADSAVTKDIIGVAKATSKAFMHVPAGIRVGATSPATAAAPLSIVNPSPMSQQPVGWNGLKQVEGEIKSLEAENNAMKVELEQIKSQIGMMDGSRAHGGANVALPVDAKDSKDASKLNFGFGLFTLGVSGALLYTITQKMFFRSQSHLDRSIVSAGALAGAELQHASSKPGACVDAGAELQSSAATSLPLMTFGVGLRTAGVALSEGKGFSVREALRDPATSEECKRIGDVKMFMSAGQSSDATRLGAGARARISAPLAQVNSDSRPSEEYMDFLCGKKPVGEGKGDCPSIIVGGKGRIGRLLSQLGEKKGYDDIIIGRGDPIPADHPGPIYVCTRNDDLAAVVAACPKEKLSDLVFLQNGHLEPFRQRYGLYKQTQAMLWLAVMRLGGKPLDGITDENPGGLTTATGKWANALKERLARGGLECNVVLQRDYRRNALEKLIWISTFMLIGQVHGGITVGEVARKHFSEVEEMVTELAGMIRGTISVSFKPQMPERLRAYAQRVDFFPAEVKEFKWRNGWFYRYSLLAGKHTTPDGRKIEMPDSTPMHTEYLQKLADKGQLDLSEVTADGVKW